MHGGIKVYRGAAGAARDYLEAGRARVDDYYLAEGTGLAERLVATPVGVRSAGSMDGEVYEAWVAGYQVGPGPGPDHVGAKGRLRTDEQGVRFVEVVVNGPKTWSLAAVTSPEFARAYEAAQERAAVEVVGWLAQHATTRIGPRGRQVQVPVEELEVAVVRHWTSRAGDPHFHLHVQVNARVWAAEGWRGLFTVGVRDSLQALNGIGHAAVAADPVFRQALADHGYTLDLESGEIVQLAPYVAGFSARAGQIGRNVDRYEAAWRAEHPGVEPGPRLRRAWDRRAWADARPDKVVPRDGAEMTRRWVEELTEQGFRPPAAPRSLGLAGHVPATAIGSIDRDAVAMYVVACLGARASAWNAADIRGLVEQTLVRIGVVADPVVRRELADDLVARAVAACHPLLSATELSGAELSGSEMSQVSGVPEHIRSLTSTRVLAVEDDLVRRIAARAEQGHRPASPRTMLWVDTTSLDPTQRDVVAALAGTGQLLVIEGAAGAGKTTTLATARELVELTERRLMVVTPTRKAAAVAARQVGTTASSAAWLAHQYGYRWDAEGRWSRLPAPDRTVIGPDHPGRLTPGDVLLVDEAGMLDQDTALALLTIADERGARVVLVGDRHQLPAVGRGGVLDLAARYTPPEAHASLDTVHRFTDPAYADLSLRMRAGGTTTDMTAVFDTLLARGQIHIHPSDVECLAAVARMAAEAGDTGSRRSTLVIADTREQVSRLNGLLRDHRLTGHHGGKAGRGGGAGEGPVLTRAGEPISVGDRVVTRRNDPDLGVANRDTWTVVGQHRDGALDVQPLVPDGRVTAQSSLQSRQSREPRTLPAEYVARYVELGYATTVHGAQGETVARAHMVMSQTTGAAAAYVGMTRGRHHNTAHLVADSVEDARRQWVEVFTRDRADLGPAHARDLAAADLDRYGPAHRPSQPYSPSPPRRPRRPVSATANRPRGWRPDPAPRSRSGPSGPAAPGL